MFNQKKSTVVTTSEIMNHKSSVTEVIETTTDADGKTITVTKRITKVDGNDLESPFTEINLIDSANSQSNQRAIKDKEKNSTKRLFERLGLKSKSKTKDTFNDTSNNITIDVDVGQFEEDGLRSHNIYREKHGVPSLKLSKQLCSYSKEWADHLAATGTFQHRPERKYGENIYTKWSSNPNHTVKGNEAVDSWYSEIKDHIFEKEPTSLASGHFTQVIWKESREVGIAISRSKDGRVYVVANYDPPGNFVGKFTENVPALKK